MRNTFCIPWVKLFFFFFFTIRQPKNLPISPLDPQSCNHPNVSAQNKWVENKWRPIVYRGLAHFLSLSVCPRAPCGGCLWLTGVPLSLAFSERHIVFGARLGCQAQCLWHARQPQRGKVAWRHLNLPQSVPLDDSRNHPLSQSQSQWRSQALD